MKISQMKKAEIMEYLKRLGDKYKYVLAVCIVGLALVSFPTEQKEESDINSQETSKSEENGQKKGKITDMLKNIIKTVIEWIKKLFKR